MQAEKLQKREKLLAFSERLKQLAGRKGLRQREIAVRLADVKSSTVGQWFRARNYPGPSVEYRLADLLSVSRDWLIEGRETAEKRETLQLREEQTYYGDSAPIAELRRNFDALILAANGDRDHLGWIADQMKEHLAIPKSWRLPANDPATTVVRVALPSQAITAEPSPSRHARPA